MARRLGVAAPDHPTMPKPRSVLRQLLDLLKRDDLAALANQIKATLSQKKEVETMRLEVWRRRTKIVNDYEGALASLPKQTLAGVCGSFQLAVESPHKETLIKTLADFLRDPDAYEYDEDSEVEEEDEEEEEDDDNEEGEEIEDEREDLTPDEQELFDLVPEDGSSIGNGRLRRDLDWKENKYWRVRDSLVEKGYLAVGFGRGGSVYRVDEDDVSEGALDEVEEDARDEDAPFNYDSTEESLYAPILQMLENNWQQLFPGFPAPNKHWVDSSPRQGRKMTGGRWTRPDLSAVTLNKYRYIPGPHLEVFSFEVKPRGQFNILGLYEALGHSRRANFAYVLFHVQPEGELRPSTRDDYLRTLEEIKREATRLRVGFATFEDPAAADTWTVHVVPGRHAPEARLLNEFVETLPEVIRKEIEFSI